MDKLNLIPGRKYLHRRKIIIDGRQMEAERWIRCLEITDTGAVFCHEYEILEMTDKEIREELIEERK